ncbi:hypothetical protein N7466_009292 [Penicillium verhagenii]|uniref:uncharacterized protein n=1 Tax=Penicillium verhagenii TaxID=1562060 RepID=UPI0025454D85|nr:uncharacterized protein N7466_009292 [Penicillium verhagenii]KAJ5920966.1 hypothetical protein N7466_009292 [Penicillium verhagenii]
MTEMYSGLHVDQRFSSLEEFKSVIRSISVRQHWELRVIRSNKKSVVIGCRSGANCSFRVVCRSNKNATYITSLQDSHSCRTSGSSTTRTPVRSEASHVRFLLSEIPKLFDMKARIKSQDVVDAVKRYHGYDISARQAQRALIRLQSHDGTNQNDTSMSLDMSAGELHSPTQSQSESQGDTGPAFRDMSETPWISDPLQPTLMEDDTVNASEPSDNLAAPVSPQSIRAPQMPPPIGNPGQSAIGNGPTPMTVSQPGIGYTTAAALPIAGPSHFKPQDYQPRNEHSGMPQMVISDFKIEFTCTTCGALNQSFFPNQGNVSGGSYMTHHGVTNPGAVTRHGDPSQHGPDGNPGAVAEDDGYNVNALNARVMQNPWATGDLGVPIGSTNT